MSINAEEWFRQEEVSIEIFRLDILLKWMMNIEITSTGL